MTKERRQYQRAPYGAWVEDESDAGGLSFHLAQNLSVGGILLRTTGDRPEVGSKVRLKLLIENEPRVMSVSGEVVRHSADMDSEFAVQFTNLDEARKTFLEDLVGELLAEEQVE